MELKQQVVSLELAKRLSELKVRQDAIWTWTNKGNGRDFILVHTPNKYDVLNSPNYSAFTVAELGEMLPPFAHSWFIEGDNIWHCDWKNLPSGSPSSQADTEANARAKMLIYLLENKLITP